MKHIRDLFLVMLISMSSSVPALAASPAFNTSPVELKNIPHYWTFDARVEAVQQSTVSAKLSGEIARIHFDVDNFVPKGAVILEFNNKTETANLEAAKATLQEAQARLDDAKKEFERTKDVYEKKLVAKSRFDRAKADLDAAQARVKGARAKVDSAQERYDDTVVTAPYAGIVAVRHVEVGETATAGQPLMTGFSLDNLRVVAAIPQSRIPLVKDLKQATILLGDGNQVESDKLTFVPYSQSRSHAFEMRIALPENTEDVYPGMFVKARFQTGTEQALVVPAGAVVRRSEVTAVYVVDKNNRVFFRQIRAGREIDDQGFVVLAGLRDGETVALEPIKAAVALKKQRQAAK